MRIIALIAICALFLAGNANDVLTCIEDSRVLVDDIFLVIESFEKDPVNPSADALKGLLAGLQKLLGECAHFQIDLTRFDKCVDEVVPIIPLIKKLVEDVQSHKKSEIIIDVTRVALELTDAITLCQKKDLQTLSF